MPIAGTGSTSAYFSAAPPISSGANKPFSIVGWGRNVGGSGALLSIANGVNNASVSIFTGSAGMYSSNYDDASTQMFAGSAGLAAANEWYMHAAVFTSASAMTAYRCKTSVVGTSAKGGSNVSTQTYTELHLGVAINDGAVLPVAGLAAYVSVWNGTLNLADITALYGGGTAGTDPRGLVSAGGATLLRLYVPNGATDLVDYSGLSGATLAAVGGAAATYDNVNLAPVFAQTGPFTRWQQLAPILAQ